MAANQTCDYTTTDSIDDDFNDFSRRNILRADFGLFYNIPRNSGALYDVTQVLDTYIYNGLTSTGDFGMTAAAGLYQSVVGFVLLMITNTVARRFDSDSALF